MRANKVKVLPTPFNGVNFRSRTEARWAVFLTAARVPYYYEPEGYDLGRDGWYLPDFWLPSLQSFLEIKPIMPVPGRESPVGALAVATGCNVYEFHGPPKFPCCDYGSDEDGGYLNCRMEDGSAGWDNQHWFCACGSCRKVGIEFNGRSCRLGCKCSNRGGWGAHGYSYDDPLLVSAYAEAANAFRY